MTILNRNAQIALAIESSEGTAESLSASDGGMLVYDPSTAVDIARFTRNPARGSLSKVPSIVGRQMASVTFTVDLMGSGAVGTEPTWDAAMKLSKPAPEPTSTTRSPRPRGRNEKGLATPAKDSTATSRSASTAAAS